MIDLDCPECGTNMIKSYQDEAKLRLKMVIWNKHGMFAVCKGCNHEVPIGPELIKSIQHSFVYEVSKKRD